MISIFSNKKSLFTKFIMMIIGVVFIVSCGDDGSSGSDGDDESGLSGGGSSTGVIGNSHTLIMFFPWSNLTSYFYNNISDMKSAIEDGVSDSARVFVCFEKSVGVAELFELVCEDGVCSEVSYATYSSGFTTKEAITTMLDDVYEQTQSLRYSLSIGAHGMGWLPVTDSSAASVMQRSVGGEIQLPHYMYSEGNPTATRYFGGTSSIYQIDISTLREAVEESEIESFEYILFDDCYMANIEIAYELRDVVDYLIASPTEIMAYGFPYGFMGAHLLDDIDYEGVVSEYYNFYSTYTYPYATIGVINCAQSEAMAQIMSEINAAYDYEDVDLSDVQRMDGYTPIIFYDFGSYVHALCDDDELLTRFDEQLLKMVPADHKAHTGEFPSNASGWFKTYTIESYSGVTISDPSSNSYYGVVDSKLTTQWYKATHDSEVDDDESIVE